MNDIISIQNAIDEKLELLKKRRGELLEFGRKKSNAMGEYEKQIALTLIGLKNGKEYILEGQTIINPPATIMRDIAKGICYQASINADMAEIDYKNLITFMESVKAELNALQSLNRHLD
jgi:hypothetical protein